MSDQAIQGGRAPVASDAPHAPARQAYHVLHLAFVVAPIVAGLDKFAMLLTDWTRYLAPQVAAIFPPRGFMHVVGVVEVVAGLLVAFKPRIGAYVVAAWLAGIIINLLLTGTYFDIALRDLGLCLGALALGRLAAEFDPPRTTA
jgi:uncharacterized membrane protein YphA (DoxX/SURF4 family)